MKQFFITGTSSGIGQALAQQALDAGNLVFGYSRRKTWSHPNFAHQSLDLSQPEACAKLSFDFKENVQEYILVNNAGWLGEVKPLAQISPKNIALAHQINFVAPSVLSATFLRQSQKSEATFTIIQISSGAANYAVPGWSSYCSSKAALNLLALSIAAEYPKVRSYAIAPGIVDTPMQAEIRSLNEEDFPDRNRFVVYKKENALSSSDQVASKILQIANGEITPADCVFSLANL